MNHKIAIIVNSSWNLYNYRLPLIRAFIEEGNEVFLIAPKDDFTPKTNRIESTKFIEWTNYSSSNKPLGEYKSYQSLKKILESIHPDYCFTFTIKPNIYVPLILGKSTKTIATLTGLGEAFINPSSHFIPWLYKQALKRVHKAVFQNIDDLNLFVEQKMVQKSKTKLINGSGIDINYFKSEKPLKNKPFTFLFIGRLLTTKGIWEFVNASKKLLKQNSSIKIQIVGDVDKKNPASIDFKSFIESIKNTSIEYLGQQSDVRSIIENTTCVVLPSYREGMPRTLLEAAAMSRPILATNVAGCRSIVNNNKNGLLCEVKNETDLYQKMLKFTLFTLKELRTMGNNGRQTIELKFDQEIIINEYLILKC